MEEFNLR